MVEYNKLLENRDNYFLSLIDYFAKGAVYGNFKISESFMLKNRELLENCKCYISVFKQINISKYWRENSFQSYEDYLEASNFIEYYERLNESLNEKIAIYNNINFRGSDVYHYVSILIDVLNCLVKIYPHNRQIYIKDLERLRKIYEELDNCRSIVFNENTIKYKKVFFDDAWFILPNSNLYNCGNGHRGSRLNYDFRNVKNAFKYSKSLEGISEFYRDKANQIKENGFSLDDFKEYLNLYYHPVFTDENNIKCKLSYGFCHEKRTLDHIIGIIKSKEYFYKFFEDVQKYCVEPEHEFAKLMDMTAHDLVDILVRCCGFHKVESLLEKTITTSDVNYKESFKDYINNGWNIVFIPPIIIQRDIGVLSQLDMDSLYVKKYLKSKN